MNLYEVPGDLVFGSIQRSISELLRVSGSRGQLMGNFSDFSYIVVAQGHISTQSDGVVVTGILPVKERGTETFISLVVTRKNCETDNLTSEMLRYLVTRARGQNTSRIYYTSQSADEALEDTLSRNGFVYEKSVEDSKTIEMVLHVAQGP